MRKNNLSKKDATGQAFLSTVLIIGGVLIVIAAGVAVFAATFVDSGYGLQASNRAESVATAGANDAYLRLVRVSSFSFPGGYPVSMPEGNATVFVTQNSPVAGEVTVTSTVTIGGRTRKINAVFGINSSTGQVTSLFWQDVQ